MPTNESRLVFGIIGVMSQAKKAGMEPGLEKKAGWASLIVPTAITGLMGVPLVKALIEKKLSQERQKGQKEILDKMLPYMAAINAPSGLLGVQPQNRLAGSSIE